MHENPYESPRESIEHTQVEAKQPRLGLGLTILNGTMWVIAVSVAPSIESNPAVATITAGVLFIMSLPLALPFILPTLGGPPDAAATLLAIGAIAVNSFVWGYGLAWLIDRVGAWANSGRR